MSSPLVSALTTGNSRHLSSSIRITGVLQLILVDRPDLADPAKLIDSDWEIEERKTVADYLNAGRPIGVGCGCSLCRICGSPNGFEEFTDGVYQWPEGLAHYVLDHAVRLPDEVVKHALRSTDSAITVGLVDTKWWIAATS